MKTPWYQSYFTNKKITVMGLGLLGRGIGDIAFLADNGARLTVTDKKTKQQLQTSIDALKIKKELSLKKGISWKPIRYVLGEHVLSDFEGRDMVVKAAGVPLDSEYIAHARKSSVPVVMSGAMVVRLIKQHFGDQVTVIGITGTRGKSTVTSLIAHVLRVAGKHVHLGGNVRGVSNLPLLAKIRKGDYVVMELDSWQLQGFREKSLSPDIAVFTSFLDDHMNYYHGDVEAYFDDKAQIFKYQKNGGILIASTQARAEIKKRFPGQPMILDTEYRFADEWKKKLLGEHNDVNIRLMVAVAHSVGISRSVIKKAVQSAEPEAGRLEYMGTVSGIHVYDDNNATSPDAVMMALGAVSHRYPRATIHLLFGGAEKSSHLAPLIRTIKKLSPKLHMLAGTGTDRFISESKLEPQLFTDFRIAIHTILKQAKRGDVFLFSPGFASFGMFVNEYDREDQFKRIVKNYDSRNSR
jgi:UDP-N-acetylmuramoylalanine--D-glutamate ligase